MRKRGKKKKKLNFFFILRLNMYIVFYKIAATEKKTVKNRARLESVHLRGTCMRSLG